MIKYKKRISLLVLIIICQFTFSQKNNSHPVHDSKEISDSNVRIAAVISHTYLKGAGIDEYLIIPSLGLDIDYWFNHKWGIGLHNDIEIENFIIEDQDSRELERVNPLVLTLDILYNTNGFILSLGPGIEIEKNKSYMLLRLGLEYEQSINQDYYFMPTIFFDQRLDGFSTATIGFGIGHIF